MVRGVYRSVVLAGALNLLNTPSAYPGTVLSVIEENVPVPMVARNRTTINRQAENLSRKEKGPQVSEFVALGCLLLDNSFSADNAGDSRINAYDPAVVDRIIRANAMNWAGCPVNIDYDGLPFKRLFSSAPLTSGKINIQPLAISKDSPAFGNIIAAIFPHPMVLWGADRYPTRETTDFESDNVFKTVSDPGELQGSAANATTVKNTKFPLSYSYKTDTVSLSTGISWINDLADSKGVSQNFQKAGFEGTADKVPGVNFNLGASYQAFSLTGGYIRSIDQYAPTQPSFTGNETEPGAWSSEIAYTTELLRKEAILAVGYQKSSEALKSYLPEQRYVTKASMTIFDGTTLSLEYYRDIDYSVKDGGVKGDGYGVTTKIGFEFPADR